MNSEYVINDDVKDLPVSFDKLDDDFNALSDNVTELSHDISDINNRINEALPALKDTNNLVSVEGTINMPLKQLIIYGRSLQEGATPSPSAPVTIVTAGSGGTLPMVSVGKNLLDVAGFTKDAGSSIDRVDVKSGTIVVVSSGGTYRGASNNSIALLPGVRYVCSGNVAGADGGVSRVAVRNARDTIKASNTTGATGAFSFTFTPTEPGWYVTVFASVGTSATGSVTYTGLQIEMATAATDFAPYNGITSAIDTTPNGLPGIPVTSGGNYTDTSGQQWICDTIDLEAGTWTKRCGVVTLDDSREYTFDHGAFYTLFPELIRATDYRNEMLCDRLTVVEYNGTTATTVNSISGYRNASDVYPGQNWIYLNVENISTAADLATWLGTHPIKVVYVLSAPVVTQLTEAQLTALRSLRGRKGLTNLYSADPAGPEISAELYIDIPTYIQGLMGGGTRLTLAGANLGAQADAGAEASGDESAEVLEDERMEALADVSDETADVGGEQPEDIDGDAETV